MRMELLWCGLLGALLMFCGDMLLYFTSDEYERDGTQKPLITIMKKIPDWRLKAGGIIGPIASFLYCLGFSHLVFLFHEPKFELAVVTFSTLCLGIVIGGTYHSHWAYIGLLAKKEDGAGVDVVLSFSSVFSRLLYLFEAVGYVVVVIA